MSESKTIYDAFCREFKAKRLVLAQRLEGAIRHSGEDKLTLSEKLNVDPALLTRYCRSYGFDLGHTLALCQILFHTSLHQLLTGARPTVLLPANLAVTTEVLETMPDSQKDAALSRLACLDPTVQDLSATFRERMNELAGAAFCSYDDLFSPHLPGHVRVVAEETMAGKRQTLRLGTAAFLAQAAQVPADYLFVQDYTRHCHVAYPGKDGKTPVNVTDRKCLRILSALLMLSPPQRSQVMAELWMAGTTRQAKAA